MQLCSIPMEALVEPTSWRTRIEYQYHRVWETGTGYAMDRPIGSTKLDGYQRANPDVEDKVWSMQVSTDLDEELSLELGDRMI